MVCSDTTKLSSRYVSYSIIFCFLVGILPCNIDMCLTWSARKDKITFKCTVNELSFSVMFYNQFNKEQAYCSLPKPSPQCYRISKNCTITQDVIRNTTILTVRGRIDNDINGRWTCYHGSNVHEAVVNVTVMREGKFFWNNSSIKDFSISNSADDKSYKIYFHAIKVYYVIFVFKIRYCCQWNVNPKPYHMLSNKYFTEKMCSSIRRLKYDNLQFKITQKNLFSSFSDIF